MKKNNIFELLEKFRDLKISKNELSRAIDQIPFGNYEGVLLPNHVIHLLKAFIEKKISQEDIINWVNIIWWKQWFGCPEEYNESVSSVIGELDMLEDIPHLRTNHLTNDEAQYYINALKNNEDVSFKPYKPCQ